MFCEEKNKFILNRTLNSNDNTLKRSVFSQQRDHMKFFLWSSSSNVVCAVSNEFVFASFSDFPEQEIRQIVHMTMCRCAQRNENNLLGPTMFRIFCIPLISVCTNEHALISATIRHPAHCECFRDSRTRCLCTQSNAIVVERSVITANTRNVQIKMNEE